MADYEVYFGSAGLPATGLTPSWNKLTTRADVDEASKPSITEVTGTAGNEGWYIFSYVASETMIGTIDGGGTLADADRYVKVKMTPYDEYLDAQISVIKTKTDGLNFTGTDVKATLDGEVVVTDDTSRTASKADVSNLDVAVSSRSTFDKTSDKVITDDASRTASKADVTNLDAAVSSRSTFDKTSDKVITDDASRTASKADVSALALEATVDAVGVIVAEILIDTNEIQGKLPTNAIADQTLITASVAAVPAAVIVALWEKVVDGTITFGTLTKLMLAFQAGKYTISGGTIVFKDQAGATIMTATVDATGRVVVIA